MMTVRRIAASLLVSAAAGLAPGAVAAQPKPGDLDIVLR